MAIIQWYTGRTCFVRMKVWKHEKFFLFNCETPSSNDLGPMPQGLLVPVPMWFSLHEIISSNTLYFLQGLCEPAQPGRHVLEPRRRGEEPRHPVHAVPADERRWEQRLLWRHSDTAKRREILLEQCWRCKVCLRRCSRWWQRLWYFIQTKF